MDIKDMIVGGMILLAIIGMIVYNRYKKPTKGSNTSASKIERTGKNSQR